MRLARTQTTLQFSSPPHLAPFNKASANDYSRAYTNPPAMASGMLAALPTEAAPPDEGFGVLAEDALEAEGDDELAAANTPPPTCDGTSDFETLAAAALYAVSVLGPLALFSRLDQYSHKKWLRITR